MQVNDALVDAHLIAIPSFTTFTVGCFTGSDLEQLSWHADGSFDAELLLLGATDEVAADCSQHRKIHTQLN